MSFLLILVQRYWMVFIPIIRKYWKIFIPLAYIFVLVHYTILVPDNYQYWIGITSISLIIIYTIIEFFFKEKKTIEIVNAYPEKETPKAKKGFSPLIKNTLNFSIPNRIKIHQPSPITLKIDSKKAVLQLAKNKASKRGISDKDFKISIHSQDLKITPAQEVNLSDLGDVFPINFKWTVEGDLIGQKKIHIIPNEALSTYLGLSEKQSNAWVETINVVNSIGWSIGLVKAIKYLALLVGFLISLPILFPALTLLQNEMTKNPQELEELLKQEFQVMEEIAKDKRLYLEEADLKWHFKNLQQYTKLNEQFKEQAKGLTNPHYKIFWLKFKRYQRAIQPKLRINYARILTERSNDISSNINTDSTYLTLFSPNFQDSILVKKFIKERKDTLLIFGFSKVCLGFENNVPSISCIKKIDLKNHQLD